MKWTRMLLLIALILCLLLEIAWIVFLCVAWIEPIMATVMVIAGTCFAIWITLELIFVTRTLYGDPFTPRNTSALGRMGLAALLTAACAAAASLFAVGSVPFAAAALIFLMCALFAFTLKYLFARAVAFKQENDLTI